MRGECSHGESRYRVKPSSLAKVTTDEREELEEAKSEWELARRFTGDPSVLLGGTRLALSLERCLIDREKGRCIVTVGTRRRNVWASERANGDRETEVEGDREKVKLYRER